MKHSDNRKPYLLLALAVLLATVGCTSVPPVAATQAERREIFRAEPPAVAPREVESPPAAVRAALLPGSETHAAPPTDAGVARFDIAASHIPARDFFMSLVEGTSYNMVVHPEVQGEISVDLKGTSVEEVLEVVHNVYGYPYFRTGSIYQVMPVGLRARTFQVNYLNLIRTGRSQTRVNSGQVTQSNNNADGTTSTNSESGSGSQIETQSVADFWSELRTAIQGLIGGEGGRKVVVQPQAGVVVVVAMPDELQLVEGYLRTVQKNLQRQVVIAAKVIEVNLNDGFQTGINWGALADGGDNSALLGQSGGGSILARGLNSTAGNSGSVAPGSGLPDGLATQAFGGVFSLALSLNNFDAFIELLQSQGDVHVLSSPRISTVNNQKAVIKVGSDEFFVTDISSDTTTGTSTNNSTDVTLTPFFSGIALDVTPQIDENGRITLHIHPTVSEVVDQTKEINVFGVNQTIPVAFSTVRESDSVVHAESGQLVVIGGLMQEKTRNEEAGIPLLSKLPGIGALFRHTRATTSKTELVILLRPQVIGGPEDWSASLEASRQRLGEMAPQLKGSWLRESQF